ncbi:MAG: gldN [Bacteroidota bacterium]|nr:gldN [Bacteroidota bacterium]
MMTIKKIAGTIVLILALQNIWGQSAQQQNPWQERDRKDAQPLPHEYQREADVFWSKNIWRIIDTREKMNKPFEYPQQPLIQIIHEAAKRGEITVYDPAVQDADQFRKVMDTSEVISMGTKIDTTIQSLPENPDSEQTVIVRNELTWDKIKKFRIKEVWFFDTKTSAMQVRIIGIAPVMEDYDAQGNYRGDMTMYWVPFEQMRGLLAKREVFNPQNDSKRFSWEDLFEMRKFESYIYKESNVYDRNVQEYATGVDAQIESERIKQELFEKEHDMWEY